ncbi:MAG: hypothetical protein KatS3mg004_2947 [Bryobacteraceae bacterium]|nr:MAG: hypothetical protein KatS3mg004_2947 [Bryobacteraceae bacterium]
MIVSRLALLFCLLAPLAAPAQETPPPPPQDSPPQAGPSPQSSGLKNWGRYFRTVERANYRPPTAAERWEIYWRSTYASPGAFFRAAGPALGDHLNHRPGTWPQGAEGYARRFANRFARFTLQDSISHASSAALGYETRYVRCGCQGFFRRFGHALAWNFLTLDRHGHTVVNAPRVGAAFAAEFIGNAWMPPGYRTTAEAVRGVGVQLGIGALFNTVREFAPRRRP